MAMKIDMESGELSEESDLCQPLLPKENTESNRTVTKSDGGSILIVLLSTFVVVLGSLEFGFSVGFSSPTETAIIEDLGLTLSQALRVSSVFYLAGWLAIAFSKEPLPLDIGRLFVGYGVGLTSYTEFVKELQGMPKAKIFDLFQRKYAHSVIVGVGLMVLQQFGGINALIFYASEIFKTAGFASGHMASVGVAALQVPMTALGALLMDKSGRRPLLMGHFDNSSLLAYASTLALVGLLVYIATFSLGMGGIPWIIMSEIFPINMKGIAGSLVSLVAWLGSWVITVSFNFLLAWSSTASFLIFCGVCAFTVLFVAKLVPETKGRTLEEIQSSFKSFSMTRT